MDSLRLADESVDVLTGFNANIDRIHNVSDLDPDLSDVEPELVKNITSIDELKKSLSYCIENSENREVSFDIDIGLEGEDFIGGQAGIISNYLSGNGNGVIFYTPLLSEELANKMNEKVLYPVIEKEFVLKNVRDASNTDRTKINHIFEYNEERSGRLILSDKLKGFGPYFRKGVEDKLEVIQENVDCGIFSGFHNIEGNKEARLKKSALQLEKLKIPIHLEYVHKDKETARLLAKYIFPHVDSIGLDETEFKELTDLLDHKEIEGNVNLGQAFEHSQDIIEEFGISRIHLHTYRYHITVTENDYSVPAERVRDSMLYSEISAIQRAETGEIPDIAQVKDFDKKGKTLSGVKELEDFGNFFNLSSFKETGVGKAEGYRVVAIPVLIHEDPERTVGMGDIISSGAFTSELK